jgi:Tfp pilus assembly protein PilO
MKKENLYSIIFLLISFAFYFFIIHPKQKTLSDLNFELSQKRLELESFDQYFKDISNIYEKLNQYQDQISKIDSTLPEDPSFVEVFYFIQKTASQNGMILDGFTFPNLTQQENLKKWSSNLRIRGDYASFKNFLSVLEKSVRMFNVEKIHFYSTKDKILSFDLTISFYSY